MRTTIRIDDTLLAQAKETAARTGRTLTATIEDALRASFAPVASSGNPDPRPLPTFGGRGLQDGVDLDDTAALLDVMETRDR